MKIGFDISALCLPRSGVGQYQYQLLRHLLNIDPKNEYRLFAFNLRSRGRFRRLGLSSPNATMKVFPIPQKAVVLSWLATHRPSLDWIMPGCDVIQVSEQSIPPSKRTKRVAFVHDLTPLLFPEYHSRSNVFFQKARFARLGEVDAILTNSEATKFDIVSHLRLNPNKIVVTPLGADDRFHPVSAAESQPVLDRFRLKSPYILFVGTLEPRKNLLSLVSAFERLKREQGIPHQLVLAGKMGWFNSPLMAAIERSPYRSEIRLTGYVADDEVPSLLSAASVFVYPSFYEGFGLPVLEAMRCGVPVVTSPLSSLPEVGGAACLYADPYSESELAGRVFAVISDSDLRNKMSILGFEQARKFSWELCARKTLEVYQRLA